MALQVWLPLNGDLHNQGLNQNVTATNHGATINDSGKIGKCYQFGTSTSYLALSKQAMRSCTTEVSICFWLKILTWNSSYETYFQAGLNGSAWPNYTFGLLRNNANSNCCFTISDGTSSSKASYLTPSLEIDTWYHISLLYKTGHCLIYMNGQLYKDYTASIVPKFSDIDRITLGMCNNYSQYQSNCQINDFRIYDHALSPKEVEDISKGLVLHYKLDNNGMGNENLFIGSAYTPADIANFVNNSSTDWTKPLRFYNGSASIHSFANGIDTITLNSTANLGIAFVRSATEINLDTNSQYTISCEAQCSSTSKPLCIGLSYYTTDNAWVWRGGTNGQNFSGVNTWQKFTLTFTPDSNTQYICYCFTVATGGNNTLKIRNCKLEKGSVATIWSPAKSELEVMATTVYDSSGYRNNGTIIGNLAAAAGSPRYDVYTNLTTTSTHIYTPALTTAGFANSFSISWWGNVSTYSGKMMWGFQDGNRLNGIYGGNLWNTGDSSSNPLYTPGTTTQVAAPTVNVWHHFVMTGDGSTCKVYKDGQLWAQAKTYKSLTGTIIYFNGWANATNYALANTKISDFRLYATALTTDQVAELYNTSMLVDASGNIIPRGLEEV